MVECPNCEGVGEWATGRNELDTNAPITRPCNWCHGTGEVTPEVRDIITAPRDEES